MPAQYHYTRLQDAIQEKKESVEGFAADVANYVRKQNRGRWSRAKKLTRRQNDGWSLPILMGFLGWLAIKFATKCRRH